MEGFRRPVPRHRAPLLRRLLTDPATLRRWVVVAALAAAAAVLTSSVIGAADDARARWADTQPVVVTTSATSRGDPLTGSVTVAEWPVALVPQGAFRSIQDVGDGARAAGPMASGAPLTEVDLSTPAADDLRRVALPHGLAPLPVSPGDQVDVWATYDPSLAGPGLQTRRVATGAEVVAVDDQVAVVAVTPGDAADLTEAVALATLTLVGVG